MPLCSPDGPHQHARGSAWGFPGGHPPFNEPGAAPTVAISA